MAALLALVRPDALWRMPAEFAPAAGLLPQADALALAPAIALGLALGASLIALRIGWARWRRQPLKHRFVFPAPLAAARRDELLPAAIVSVWAGVTEEIAFRLGLPLFLTLVIGHPLPAFLLAGLLFAALHRYQPWLGRIAVFGAGLVLAGLYLATGALWLAIAVHAVMDLIGLVLRPWLAGFRAAARA